MCEIHSLVVGSYEHVEMEMTEAQFDRYWKAIDVEESGKFEFK